MRCRFRHSICRAGRQGFTGIGSPINLSRIHGSCSAFIYEERILTPEKIASWSYKRADESLFLINECSF
ncbi:hypothetical protein K1719_030849 [Acacia pycnantha]|nr:hypothetical protein K1719_030849 [Acacia pycnantha]